MGKVVPSKLQNIAIGEFLSKDPPKFSGSEVLVFIPVHNEEHTIADMVAKVKQSCNFDLLVIDDGSVDSTPDILRQLGVEVLKHPVRLGSHAILSGIKIGHDLGYKYVIKIDGDDQQNPQDIPRLYEHAIKTGADITIGSRHLHRFSAKILSITGIGMWFCSKLVSLLTGKRVTDTTSGFKIWSRDACKVAIAASQEGRLKEGSTYHIEELIIAAKQKLRVEEINVTMRPRQNGETKSFERKKLVLFPLNLLRSTVRALLWHRQT